MHTDARGKVPHPILWTILYFPFGALSGFVSALTILANGNGLSISEGAWLNGAQLISQWLKWIWAPAIDVTLTPKKWYVIGTGCSALGVLLMSAIPLSVANLGLLLPVIAIASLLNSIVGMSIEAIMAAVTTKEELGRSSAWFQAGNLGGSGIALSLGVFGLTHFPAHWMAGAMLGGLFMACCSALFLVPDVGAAHTGNALAAVGGAFRDVLTLGRTKGGLLAAVLCFMPLGTGAAQGVLIQEDVAALWGAGPGTITAVQGLLAGAVTVVGCFAGGWLCDRLAPRTAYAVIGLTLGAIAVAMGVAPAWVVAVPGAPVWFTDWVGTTDVPVAYVVGNLVYAFGVGLAYAAFTAVVLEAIGAQSAATKYTTYASLSNFPIWWLGLVLGSVAQHWGGRNMLFAEAAFGVAAVALFFVVDRVIRNSALPDAPSGA